MKKIYITILLLILVSLPSFAQMIQQWINTEGGPGHSYFWTHKVMQDNNYNTYLMIWAQYLPSAQSIYTQPFLIKINPSGQTEWVRDYGYYPDRNEHPYDILIDKNNFVYYYCYQVDTNNRQSSTNLIKIDGNGNTVWKKYFGSPCWPQDNINMMMDSSGNIFVPHYPIGIGDSYKFFKISPQGDKLDSIIPYNVAEANILADNDKIVIYYDDSLSLYKTDGIKLWGVKTHHIGKYPRLLYDKNSNSIFLAYFRTETLQGNVFSLNKFDINGNLLWQTENLGPSSAFFSTYNYLSIPHLAITGDNNLVVGTTMRRSTFNDSNIAYVAKFNSQTGDSLWSKRTKDSGDVTRLMDLIIDSQSNIYITGFYGNSGWPGYSVQKFSAAGERIRKTNHIGYLNDSLLFAPLKLAVNNSTNELILGGYSDRASSNTQVYSVVIKYSQPVNITPFGSELPNNFSLKQNYPNPFNPVTVISFKLPVAGNTTIKVYDINGREVSELVNENLQAGEYKIDFNGGALPSGMYFYKLTSGNFSETKKMILIK